MKADDRERLEAKRILLKLRQQRAYEARTFRAIAPLLCKADVRFSRIPAVACRRALHIIGDVPSVNERINWHQIAGARCDQWQDLGQAKQLLHKALEELSAKRLLVVFHPAESGLAVAPAELLRHAEQIMEAASSTLWILPLRTGTWFIEVSLLDQEVCFSADICSTLPAKQ